MVNWGPIPPHVPSIDEGQDGTPSYKMETIRHPSWYNKDLPHVDLHSDHLGWGRQGWFSRSEVTSGQVSGRPLEVRSDQVRSGVTSGQISSHLGIYTGVYGIYTGVAEFTLGYTAGQVRSVVTSGQISGLPHFDYWSKAQVRLDQ